MSKFIEIDFVAYARANGFITKLKCDFCKKKRATDTMVFLKEIVELNTDIASSSVNFPLFRSFANTSSNFKPFCNDSCRNIWMLNNVQSV